MKSKSVVVVGSGAVGLATAAEYAFAGYQVSIGEVDGFESRIPRDGNYFFKGLSFGRGNILAPTRVTVQTVFDFKNLTAKNCSAVIVATTAVAHSCAMKKLSNIDPDVPVILICGNGSRLAYSSKARLVSETNTAPYGVRRHGDLVEVKILTPKFGVSGLKKDDVSSGLEVLRPIFGEAFELNYAIDALLSNPNPLMHVTIMLANLTRIDKGEHFAFYETGVTDSVLGLIAAKNDERIKLAKSAGSSPIAFDDLEGVVCIEGQLVTQHFLECGSISKIAAPTSIKDRYFTEDVPYGLVPWEAIANRLSVPTPIISSEIDQVSAILHRDFRSEARRRTEQIMENL